MGNGNGHKKGGEDLNNFAPVLSTELKLTISFLLRQLIGTKQKF